jgi:signal transduction histidine kinase
VRKQNPTLRSTLARGLELVGAFVLLVLCVGFLLGRRSAQPGDSWVGNLGEFGVLLAGGAAVLWLTARLAAQRIARRALAPLRGLADAVRGLVPGNFGEGVRVEAADAELRRLQEELNAALLRLEEGYRAQAHFAGNVAHELKTPIAALVTDAQVSRRSGHDPEYVRAFMARAEAELKHLGELVESLLVMARVDSREHRADLVFLDDVVRRAVRRSAEQAREAGVRLRLALAKKGDPAIVCGDAQLLLALVENLIRNAVHHSPHGAEVVLEISVGGGNVRILVRDQGPGIADDLRASVFARGVRLANAPRIANGAGLGLAIVDDIVRLHHGSVAVQGGEGGGCVLVVQLPTASETRHRNDASERALPGS